MQMQIDLNSDLGESFGDWTMGNDAQMLEIISSANIACGFHAGDSLVMQETIKNAKANNVVIGAHVSYPDLQGFGRRNMDIPSKNLIADIIYQISALQGMAKSAGAKVDYVKPHGALYNKIAQDKRQADDVIFAIKKINNAGYNLALVALANSPLINWASDAGIRVISEAFADRSYTPQGQLVPRGQDNAVLHDADLIAARICELMKTGNIKDINGDYINLKADTICVHGDTKGALLIAQKLREKLVKSGVEIKSFIK